MKKKSADVTETIFYGPAEGSEPDSTTPLEKDYTPLLFGIALMAFGGIIVPTVLFGLMK